MRILIVSNLYPPFFQGGYEIACKQVVDALKLRGHEVIVLTSIYGINKQIVQGDVYRQLELLDSHPYLPRWVLYRAWINQQRFTVLSRSFRPDVVFAWNLGHVSVSIIQSARLLKIPIYYYIFDNWLANWESDPLLTLYRSKRNIDGILKALGKAVGLYHPSDIPELHNAIFASNYLKRTAIQKGILVENNPVLWWGIDADRFKTQKNKPGKLIKLLYVGQLIEHKGVHTIIQALDHIVHGERRGLSYHLTLVGDLEQVPEYVNVLLRHINDNDLGQHVTFMGRIDNDALPAIYADHDIFIFSSIWDEPFGITQLEAMVSGLPVVGTATGGSAEIIRDSVNALIFEKNNPISCARQILRLAEDPELFNSISSEGRRTAEKHFQFKPMVSAFERMLQQH